MTRVELNQDIQASLDEVRPITNAQLLRKKPLDNVHAASAENISSSEILQVPVEINKSRIENNKRYHHQKKNSTILSEKTQNKFFMPGVGTENLNFIGGLDASPVRYLQPRNKWVTKKERHKSFDLRQKPSDIEQLPRQQPLSMMLQQTTSNAAPNNKQLNLSFLSSISMKQVPFDSS